MLYLPRQLCVSFVFFCGYPLVAFESRPLRILFVVEYFPSLSQIYILNMITGLIDRGHNVSIFSFRKNNDPNMHPHIQQYNLLSCVTYEKFPKKLPDYDIVFCQFGGLGKTVLEMPQLAGWLQQRKMVVCLRGFDMMDYVNNPRYLNEWLFSKVDLFLPVCDHFKKRLIALGCPSEKVKVHHSAINCSQFSFKARKKPAKEPIKAVFVGRLVRKKGISFAIKAIAQLIKKNHNIQLLIVGEGPEREKLELLIQKLKLTKQQVTLCGWKTHDEVVAILHKAHIFVHPSVTPSNGNEEGIANALKEAMAMGLISIATWHAGTPELIDDNVSGFLVPEKDTDALVNAIRYVIQHPERWQSIGLAARKKIEDEFEVKKMAEELEKIFYALLDDVKEIVSNEYIEHCAMPDGEEVDGIT
jgi:colanic acid/amylovoran biosynthesis glycosyltransferase